MAKANIPRICRQCGTDFLALPYEVSTGKAQFCGRACMYASRRGKHLTAVERQCGACGKPFMARKSRLLIGEGKFCSQRCAQDSRKVAPLRLTCPTCGKEFDRYHWEVKRSKSVVACSQQCAFTERKRQVAERHQEKGAKKCPGCGQEKPFEDFGRARRERSGHTVYCRACQAVRGKKYRGDGNTKRAVRKARLVIRLGNKCAHCGAANLPICCYEFHHKDGAEKEFTIGSYLSQRAFDIEAEIAKCELLCSYCHAIHHAVYSDKPAHAYVN